MKVFAGAFALTLLLGLFGAWAERMGPGELLAGAFALGMLLALVGGGLFLIYLGWLSASKGRFAREIRRGVRGH